jgi:hypothetical protein
VASNVALRRQVFESKANSSDASWRCSDDKSKDDKASQSRSLSVESVKENEVATPTTAAAVKKERPKPVRENSYLTAVRSSPEVAPVILRQKAQTHHRMMSEEDDRKTRRTSYLKATNEEFQVASDTDQNSVSMTPDDEDNQQQMKR